MIGPIVIWWLAGTVVAAAAFPLVWRFFDRLPDRGFGVTRALGVLAGGYVLWMGASLGWIHNNPAGAIAALLVVAVAGAAAVWPRRSEFAAWLRSQWRTLLIMEVIFLTAFVAWAVVRAYNPEIVATEKPMELAFLNALLRSPALPPQDPWLSGHAISYYYLGYVLLTFLTWLTGTAPGVTFNLGNAMWFAFVAVGSYAIVYDLLTLRGGSPRRLAAGLGPIFVLISGNLGGVLEVLHARHVFWATLTDGTLVSRFWTWLNLEDLVATPLGAPVFPPARFWWWWQASRVVNDIDLAGRHVEVIDEFPFFSFLLADNHPHVLALPFAIAAIAVAIQVLVTPRRGGFRFAWLRISPQTQSRVLLAIAVVAGGLAIGRAAAVLAAGAPDANPLAVLVRSLVGAGIIVGAAAAIGAVLTGRVSLALSAWEILAVGWLAGALAFLNTWDLPIYLALILAAAAWGLRGDGAGSAAGGVLWAGVAAVSIAAVAILPWLPTFSSQAGGVLPNLIFPTRLVQFLIMFLVPLVPAVVWLLLRTRGEFRRPGSLRLVVGIAVGLPLALWIFSWILTGVIALVSPDQAQGAALGLGASGIVELALSALARRAGAPWVALLIGLMLSTAWLYLRRSDREGSVEGESDSGVFVALLFGLGGLLVLAPEFVYLRDLFGTRMNTVFKFYYAAWLVWGLAAAYGLARIWEWKGRRGLALGLVASIPLLLGLVYPVLAVWEKTGRFSAPSGPTLDGTAHLWTDSPADALGILWMRSHLEPGIVAEAVGGSYTQFGRISGHTGFPTVLGWDFHEYQWRGSFEPQGTRKEDIDLLYQTREWAEAQRILDQYDIDYVYVGPLERSAYPGLVTRKFDAFMERLFDSGEVTIYGRKTEVGS